MKLYLSLATFFAALTGVVDAAAECTHGRLYISELEQNVLHTVDVSEGDLSDLTSLVSETTYTVSGGVPLTLAATGSHEGITVMYRGDSEVGYTDGFVKVFDTGLVVEAHGDHNHVEYTAPSEITNAGFECARAIHYVPHDGRIAIFCDGTSLTSPVVNSTIWVLDESLFGTDDSAIVFSTTLESSHHGVAIPVDEDHVLHSLATASRLAGVADSSSLPNTFQVVDYNGTVLHSIDDEADPDNSCIGFHGEASVGDSFALACNADHGGILVVDYDSATETYSSRAILYPEEYTEHRTGSLQSHHENDMVVGNFAGNDQNYLMAFGLEHEQLQTNQLYNVTEGYCGFAYEMGAGHHLMVMHPSGVFQALEYENDAWSEIASVTLDGISSCDNVIMVPGVLQGFVLYTAEDSSSTTLFAIDMEHAEEGELEVYSTELDFVPYSAVVAGFNEDSMCTSEEHDHDDDETDGGVSHGLFTAFVSVGLLAMVI